MNSMTCSLGLFLLCSFGMALFVFAGAAGLPSWAEIGAWMTMPFALWTGGIVVVAALCAPIAVAAAACRRRR
jgi:hypothetical protein